MTIGGIQSGGATINPLNFQIKLPTKFSTLLYMHEEVC